MSQLKGKESDPKIFKLEIFFTKIYMNLFIRFSKNFIFITYMRYICVTYLILYCRLDKNKLFIKYSI